MRTAILMLVITMLCCCKKHGNDFSAVRNNLVSKWELREMKGGFAGTIIYQPGNERIFEFKSDLSFVSTDKGNIIYSGTYDLQTTSVKDQYRLTILRDTVKHAQDIYLKNDTLVFLAEQSCCDIPSFVYLRIQP